MIPKIQAKGCIILLVNVILTETTKKKINILSDITIHAPDNTLSFQYQDDELIISSEDTNNNETNTDTTEVTTETFIRETLQNMISAAVEKSESNLLTKRGEKRKRRKFGDSLSERKKTENGNGNSRSSVNVL